MHFQPDYIPEGGWNPGGHNIGDEANLPQPSTYDYNTPITPSPDHNSGNNLIYHIKITHNHFDKTVRIADVRISVNLIYPLVSGVEIIISSISENGAKATDINSNSRKTTECITVSPGEASEVKPEPSNIGFISDWIDTVHFVKGKKSKAKR